VIPFARPLLRPGASLLALGPISRLEHRLRVADRDRTQPVRAARIGPGLADLRTRPASTPH